MEKKVLAYSKVLPRLNLSFEKVPRQVSFFVNSVLCGEIINVPDIKDNLRSRWVFNSKLVTSCKLNSANKYFF